MESIERNLKMKISTFTSTVKIKFRQTSRTCRTFFKSNWKICRCHPCLWFLHFALFPIFILSNHCHITMRSDMIWSTIMNYPPRILTCEINTTTTTDNNNIPICSSCCISIIILFYFYFCSFLNFLQWDLLCHNNNI